MGSQVMLSDTAYGMLSKIKNIFGGELSFSQVVIKLVKTFDHKTMAEFHIQEAMTALKFHLPQDMKYDLQCVQDILVKMLGLSIEERVRLIKQINDLLSTLKIIAEAKEK